MNIRPQDLLSREPTLWFRRHQLFGIGASSFYGHKLPQSLCISVVEVTVAALKLQVSGVAILSVQFLIHASSSICICPVWRICMTTGAFLMCAASVSERVLAKPIWKARDLPEGEFEFAMDGERACANAGEINVNMTSSRARLTSTKVRERERRK